MKNLFKTLVLLAELGELKKANYYDEEFATLEFEKDGKTYCISMRCEDATNGKY